MGPESLVQWKVDECAVYFDRMHVRGWCAHAAQPVTRVELRFDESGIVIPLGTYGQASPDVAAAVGPFGTHARFDEWVHAPAHVLGRSFSLRFVLADGTEQQGVDALTNAAHGDPYFQGWENFLAMLGTFPSGAVLEVGSRARSAVTRRHRVPACLEYVGLDILPGPNVDVVGDAHELSSIFREKRFVAVFSASVFEHLAMPWKVALEMNRILAPGGIVYTSSHQTWPLHEEPWDFWRYSKNTWKALFNEATGFEILEAVMGEPARIHACRTSSITQAMPDCVAYLGSSSLVRKIRDTELSWPVPLDVAADAAYPAGELSVAPTQDRA